ncbi:hypothetical protein DPMN_030009 [Dreissena polymorpha]|uniref:Uncharacterized protein n=1 Tax=Dreissena polymorpha TaxID=45954 RepID=A0A9D4LZK8_DREPO|nr:hypothetical protein DPMN_030009 [Dreissena polymorpha]
MEIVRDIARRRPGMAFLYHDTQFRLLRESVLMPWDRIHTEYWLMACMSFQQPQQPFRPKQPPNRSYSTGPPSNGFSKKPVGISISESDKEQAAKAQSQSNIDPARSTK